MDMESILNGYKPEEPITTQGNSEPSEVSPNQEPETSAAEGAGQSVEDPEGGQAVASEEGGVGTETNDLNEPKAKASSLSRSDKQDYSITRWKKRFRNMKAQRDQIAAEFEKYKNLNPAMFRNPEDRAAFIAWRASAGQRVQDMDEDLNAMYNQQREEEYERKMNYCYTTPESEQSFHEAEDEVIDAFNYMCDSTDRQNVIRDYLEKSPVEPAMRMVIYKSDEVQRALFADYGNPAIAAAERLNILKGVENEVKQYFASKRSNPPQKMQPNQSQPAANRIPRWNLQPRRANGQFAPGVMQQPATAQPPRPANPQPRRPQVTGSLTRGGDTGKPDMSSAVSGLYTKLFGSHR